FSFDVTKRMLDALESVGSINRTNLAQKTGLNYNVCLRYIKMLKLIGWIETCLSDRGDCVSITEVGRQVNTKLLDDATVSSSAAGRTMVVAGSGHSSSSNNNDRRETKRSLAEEQGEMRQKPKNTQQHHPPNQPGSSLLPSFGGEKTITSKTAAIAKPVATRKKNPPYNIMIVDDEPDIIVTYQYFLTPTGYNVSAFSDAYEALRDFTSRPSSYYDLVILDIRMPGLNGLQLHQSFKAMDPSCKIIFISALEAAREMVSILPGLTMDDIMRKPVDKRSFLKKINDVLG
ncbi:MAG TPA: response regulator, partial [Nitrososphaera sp.]|nr:response regulator [Nitrososphaera sp.]